MFNKAPDSPLLVPFDGTFSRAETSTKPPQGAPKKSRLKQQLNDSVKHIDGLQRLLYAHNQYSVLLVFQGMDAAGKDSTIRALLRGVNPAGCQVASFKQPSAKELDHDFLWRINRALPERGRIGVFNRSHYEEVLVVRVHPEYLKHQNSPSHIDTDSIWQSRYQSIRQFEEHLAQNGTVILKFWLNVSLEEQRQRFLDRLEKTEKNWKFSKTDIEERQYWPDYMQAFETALAETSRPWAPWYAIPADSKPYMRTCIADIVVQSLQTLDLQYPTVNNEEKAQLNKIRTHLLNENDS